jgi:hypothetical protein
VDTEEKKTGEEEEEATSEVSSILSRPLSKDIKILPFSAGEQIITGLYEPYKSEFFSKYFEVSKVS